MYSWSPFLLEFGFTSCRKGKVSSGEKWLARGGNLRTAKFWFVRAAVLAGLIQ